MDRYGAKPAQGERNMSNEYADVANAGIKLLDESGPSGWRDLVDVNTLRLESCEVCVLGQVFGSFDTGLDNLDLTSGTSKDYGFNTDYSMQELTKAWKDALGKNDILVEVGDVYHDQGGCCAAKVIATKILALDDKAVTVYLYRSGSIEGGVFKQWSDEDEVNVARKEDFEADGSFPIRLFTFKAGQFATNAEGEVFYVLSPMAVRKVEDQATILPVANINKRGMREVRTATGALFSSTIK
jgi:hypothetical protein